MYTELTNKIIDDQGSKSYISVEDQILSVQNPPNKAYIEKMKDIYVDFEKPSNPRIKIPLFMTFLLKKIYWAEKHKTFNISATIIMRIITDDLIEILKEKLGATEIINPMNIIQSLTKYNFRVNDLNTIELKGNAKPLNIQNYKDELKREIHRKNIKLSDVDVNEFRNTIAVKKIEKYIDYKSSVKGYSSTFRTQLTDILINSNESMANYPYNYQDIILKMELEPKILEVECQFSSVDNSIKNETYLIEFSYDLRDSIIPQNVFSAKMADVDGLDTHEAFWNYHGYRYCIEKNVVNFYISLKHGPDFAYQFTLLPMLVLQAFQIVICLYGPVGMQLANLISVYIAYGAFAIIASQETFMTKDISILDELYYISLGVSIFQFIDIIAMSIIDPYQEECTSLYESYSKYICALDGITISIAVYTLLYSISEYYRLYDLFLKKRNISEKYHDDLILNKNSNNFEKISSNLARTSCQNLSDLKGFIKNSRKYKISLTIDSFKIIKNVREILDYNLNRFINYNDINFAWFNYYKLIYGQISDKKGGDVILLEEWRMVNDEYIKNKTNIYFHKNKLFIQSLFQDPFYVEYYINRYLTN